MVRIEGLPAAPHERLSAALTEFERRFLYPLGHGMRFRISHGGDYGAFFRAIGKARVLVATRPGAGGGEEESKPSEMGADRAAVDSTVLGTLAFVRRSLVFRGGGPGSQGEQRQSHYFCDLKVRPEVRGAPVLARLIAAAKREIEPGELHACHAIVMDGTASSPLEYTGRLGVPRFRKLAEIMILRLPWEEGDRLARGATIREVGHPSLLEIQGRLAPAGFFLSGGNSGLRSLMRPRPLADAEGLACGVLEDTRKAKRLFTEGGAEMLSAHLSGFVSASPARGAALLRAAQAAAAAEGLPALFVSVPRAEAGPLLAELGNPAITLAPATVFGHHLPSGHDWRVDTAEI